jgi:hypothetical protein
MTNVPGSQSKVQAVSKRLSNNCEEGGESLGKSILPNAFINLSPVGEKQKEAADRHGEHSVCQTPCQGCI